MSADSRSSRSDSNNRVNAHSWALFMTFTILSRSLAFLDVPWQSFPSRSDLATSRIDTFPATSARHFVKTTHALHYSSLQSSTFVLRKFIPCFCPSPSSKQANTQYFFLAICTIKDTEQHKLFYQIKSGYLVFVHRQMFGRFWHSPHCILFSTPKISFFAAIDKLILTQ